MDPKREELLRKQAEAAGEAYLVAQISSAKTSEAAFYNKSARFKALDARLARRANNALRRWQAAYDAWVTFVIDSHLPDKIAFVIRDENGYSYITVSQLPPKGNKKK